MLFIYTNAIITLVLFIIIQVQTIVELIEVEKKLNATINGTIISLVMYIFHPSIYCYINTIYVFFKDILLEKTKYKIIKYIRVIIVIQQIFVIIALKWGLK